MTDRAIEHGSAAAGPTDISARGWREVLVRSWQEGSEDNIPLISAGVAFYGFLAFVPMLASIVLVYGIVVDPVTVAKHIRHLFCIMPGEAASLIGEQLTSMTEGKSAPKGFALLLALLLSIYGAMRGAGAIITALNVCYEVAESRGFVRTTMLALLITIGAIAALMVAVAGIAALAAIERLFPFSSPAVHMLLQILFWTGAAVAISGLIAIVYRYAPDRPDAKWRWLTPGSIAATLLWLAATLGFGFYVSNFGNYNATYGSLGAVVVFLSWLYLTAYILLMGAELNSELEKQTYCETLASPRPTARNP